MRTVTDAERRHRLGRRHALARGKKVATPEEATAAVAVLHATEPATVYLSCWARVPGMGVEDVDRALYRDRTLVKQLAMRRTLFVFPRALLPAAWGSASARVAGAEGRRMAGDVVRAGLDDDGAAWLERSRAAVLAVIDDDGLTAQEVRAAVPEVGVTIEVSAGQVWGHSRVITHLALTADLVRGENTQHWRLSRPRWTPMEAWLGEPPEPLPEGEGYAALVTAWLARFGPGAEDDLVWWLGATKAAVRAALADVGAVEVALETPAGATGWLLPDDVEEVADPGPWVALLPVLDPTVMGWRHRDFYLGPHGPRLFDRNGNAGTTAWVDGRVVGTWVQDAAGRVHLGLEEEVDPRELRALEAEAERLTAWLDGVRVGTVYPSPAMKDARDRLVTEETTP